ncbi:unnamed protein product [Clonostachys rosea]|uniref:BTB domain-containing protein n=1 Tax=Bionectria ochroleuca TaxID=29856 RepID=A0ABY6UEB3_BIOOC|nr:unnamed protein product [Clonostachys rosea]
MEMPGTRPGNYSQGSENSLFRNNKDADVLIFVGDRPLRVLAEKSRYFRVALAGPFIEGTTKVFKFLEGSDQAYWRVIHWMYYGYYLDPWSVSERIIDDGVMKNLRVYQAADYLGVEGDLIQLAFDLFERDLMTLHLRNMTVTEVGNYVREMYATILPQHLAWRKRVVRYVKPWFTDALIEPQMVQLLFFVEGLAAELGFFAPGYDRWGSTMQSWELLTLLRLSSRGCGPP